MPSDQNDYCSISFDDLDMNEWVGMEAEAPHEFSYYMYHFGREIISTDNHIDHHSYYGVSLDQEQRGYNSLWQETISDAVM